MSEDRPKVVGFRSGQEIIPPGTPRPHLIALCEDLLERAKSGELMGLAVARLHSDGSTSSRMEGRNNYALIGTFTALQHLLIDDLESCSPAGEGRRWYPEGECRKRGSSILPAAPPRALPRP